MTSPQPSKPSFPGWCAKFLRLDDIEEAQDRPAAENMKMAVHNEE